MLLQGKMVKFFYLHEGELRSKNLKRLEDLEELIESYQAERLSEAERAMILSTQGAAPDDDASLVKYRKIQGKYRALLKDEKKLMTAKTKQPEPVQEQLFPLEG